MSDQKCAACDAERGADVVCSGCGALMADPLGGLDHFARLGQPRGFDIDKNALQLRLLELSRLLHPDFWRGRGADQHALSQELSSRLNEAYSTLRDSKRRADYLIRLEGGPSPDEDKSTPPGFLKQVFELRKRLPSVQASGDESALAELRTDLGARRDHWMNEVASALRTVTGGNGNGGVRGEALTSARLGMNVLTFLDNLLSELDS